MYASSRGLSSFIVILICVQIVNTLKVSRVNPNRVSTLDSKSNTGNTVVEEMPSAVKASRGRIGSNIDNALTLVLNADYKPLSYVRYNDEIIVPRCSNIYII